MSRTLRFIAVIVSVCGFAAGLCASASAAPADTDRSFGQEGFVDLSHEGFYSVSDMAIGSDDSIYVLRSIVECTFGSCYALHAIRHLGPNGWLDGSFGSGGVSTALGASFETRRPGASLGLVGSRAVAAWTEQGQVVLRRLNPDGSLDGGFGGGGTARIDFGIPVDTVRIAVQGDGRIVVVAEPEAGYGSEAVMVACLTAQGAPDPTFNGGVPVITTLGSGFGGMALTSGGEVVLAGPRCCGVNGRAVHVARLDPVGAFDSGFGRAGQVFVDDVVGGVGVSAAVVSPNGRIYLAGSDRRNEDAFVLRLLPDGGLDRTFGHRGIAYMRGSHLDVTGIGLDRAGRLFIFGTATDPQEFESDRLAVLRRLENGRRDPSFAGGSLEHLDGGSTEVVSGGVQHGHKLVVLAQPGRCARECPSESTFLTRFIGGSGAPRCAGRSATIVGTRRADEISGTRHRDVIAALAGNDTVLGRGGDDIICGGRGNDRLIGGRGRDVLRGGPGRNSLRQ